MYSVFTGQSIEYRTGLCLFRCHVFTWGKLDPLGLLTELTQPEVAGEEEEEPEPPVRMQNIDYLCWWEKYNIVFIPNGNYSQKGMYESASIYKAYDTYEKGKYRTAWGYQGGLEFYPMTDDNLHIFLTAIGKKYNLSERAKALDASLDDTPHAFRSVSFIDYHYIE